MLKLVQVYYNYDVKHEIVKPNNQEEWHYSPCARTRGQITIKESRKRQKQLLWTTLWRMQNIVFSKPFGAKCFDTEGWSAFSTDWYNDVIRDINSCQAVSEGIYSTDVDLRWVWLTSWKNSWKSFLTQSKIVWWF